MISVQKRSVGRLVTLRHLKIFVTVCDCGSMTQAAGRLYLAQPAVSLAIRELEEAYGVRLLIGLPVSCILPQGEGVWRNMPAILRPCLTRWSGK